MTDRREEALTDGARLDREAAIVHAFVHLSDTLVADYDVIELLTFLTERCVELSSADEAAVMLAAPTGQLQAVASSSERSRLLELFELQSRDGPCLDAFRTGAVVSSADLEVEVERWPIFAPHATAVGFRSVHSVPLRLRDERIGALNLLKTEQGALSEVDASLVRALSDIATVAVLQERSVSRSLATATSLQTALISRIHIEQAKGVLAERAGVSIDEAFALLRQHARSNYMTLTSVAEAVIARTLDLGPPDGAR